MSRRPGPRRRLAGLPALLLLATPAALAGQYAIASPQGDSLAFELEALRTMLDTARALRTDIEMDPHVLYYLGFGPPAEMDAPQGAYPWNAVLPESDSVVRIQTPGNLREADRAYHNYAVMRMREIRREDPDDPCDALVSREAGVLSHFVDGWVVARTLFGGPTFAPLDEFAFARDAGHLEALVATRRDASVGACAAVWAEAHPERIAAYEDWRAENFPALAATSDPAPADAAAPPADAADAVPDSAGAAAAAADAPPDSAGG